MRIYTVVGVVDREGIQGFIFSFKERSKAEAFKIFCEYYNSLEEKSREVGWHEEWKKNHPAKDNYPYFDIIESELVGGDA